MKEFRVVPQPNGRFLVVCGGQKVPMGTYDGIPVYGHDKTVVYADCPTREIAEGIAAKLRSGSPTA